MERLEHKVIVDNSNGANRDDSDGERTEFLFARIAEDLQEVSDMLREMESKLSLDDVERELIAQTHVNLTSLLHLCNRKQETSEGETAQPEAKEKQARDVK